MTGRERRTLLAVLGFLSFTSIYVATVMSPVLTQIAREFGISTGAAGLVVAAYGAPAALLAVIAGPYSDRYGRKRFLVGGSLVMGVCTVVSAFAPTFPFLTAARAAAGVGAAVVFPNITATVADNFEYRERGRAMSTVIGMNTMGGVIGVPVAGILAEATSWRASVFLVGALAIVAALVLLFRLRPAAVSINPGGVRELYHSVLTNVSAVAAVISALLGGVYWFTWATYIVVFFQLSFGLPQGLASTFALTQGLGVLVGSQIGGRMGDRMGHRRVVAGAILLSALVLLFQTNVPVGLGLTTALTLLLSAIIGARFATNATLLTEQVPRARGTLLALSAATNGASQVLGATVGGVLIDQLGFWAVGMFCMVFATLSCVLVLTLVRERPIDMELSTA